MIIGLVYGVSKSIVAFYNQNMSDPVALAVVFTILIIILLVKPEGLFGRKR